MVAHSKDNFVKADLKDPESFVPHLLFVAHVARTEQNVKRVRSALRQLSLEPAHVGRVVGMNVGDGEYAHGLLFLWQVNLVDAGRDGAARTRGQANRSCPCGVQSAIALSLGQQVGDRLSVTEFNLERLEFVEDALPIECAQRHEVDVMRVENAAQM